jgi:hypothetical protein
MRSAHGPYGPDRPRLLNLIAESYFFLSDQLLQGSVIDEMLPVS